MYVHDKYTRALGCSGIEGGPAPDPVLHLDNDMHTENTLNVLLMLLLLLLPLLLYR